MTPFWNTMQDTMLVKLDLCDGLRWPCELTTCTIIRSRKTTHELQDDPCSLPLSSTDVARYNVVPELALGLIIINGLYQIRNFKGVLYNQICPVIFFKSKQTFNIPNKYKQ